MEVDVSTTVKSRELVIKEHNGEIKGQDHDTKGHVGEIKGQKDCSDVKTGPRVISPDISIRPCRDAEGSTGKMGGKLHKSMSLDSGDGGEAAKRFKTNPLSASIKRKSIRRRASVKRLDKPEDKFGHDKEAYESIRERVLQERAVVNAIEALQERWKMLMFMNDDCTAMNDTRKQRKLAKLTVQRQEELLILLGLFLVACIPVSVLLVVVCRFRV